MGFSDQMMRGIVYRLCQQVITKYQAMNATDGTHID